MKPAQTIFNKDTMTVTISIAEYNKLQLYKQFALEIKGVLTNDD